MKAKELIEELPRNMGIEVKVVLEGGDFGSIDYYLDNMKPEVAIFVLDRVIQDLRLEVSTKKDKTIN